MKAKPATDLTATAAVTMDVAPARVPTRKRLIVRRNRLLARPMEMSRYLIGIGDYSALAALEITSPITALRAASEGRKRIAVDCPRRVHMAPDSADSVYSPTVQ